MAALSSMFIPETLGEKLPETLAEAKVFGKGQPFWSMPRINCQAEEEEDAKEKLNQPENLHLRC